jgi:hypothetical protein
MQFLYFVPVSPVNLSELTKRALGYVFDGPAMSHVTVNQGPGGQRGEVVVQGSPALPPAYLPDQQDWIEAGHDGVWIGWYRDQPPTPDELIRPDAFGKWICRLGDGNIWTIPTAVREDGTTMLPEAFDLDASGEVIRRVQKRYQPLLLAGLSARDAFTKSLPMSVRFTIAASALATNYRISPREIAALELFTDMATIGILSALIDLYDWASYKQQAAAETKPE